MFSSEPISFTATSSSSGCSTASLSAARPIRPSPLIATLLAMYVSSASGRGSLAANQVTLGGELGGEGGVAGEAEDLELAVGPLAGLHHAAAVAVELAGSHHPDHRGAIAQRLTLGEVLVVLLPEGRVQAVHQRRPVLVGDRVVELDQEDQPGGGAVDQLGDGGDEVVAAPQRGQRLVDGGDDLDLVELLAGERDDALALLDEPDEGGLAVVPRDLEDVVHLVAVQARGIGDIDEIALPNLQLLEPQQLAALGGAVIVCGVELEHVGPHS